MRTRVIQLQLLRNHPSLNVEFSISISIIDNSPHGNSKKVDGLPSFGVVGMVESLKKDRAKSRLFFYCGLDILSDFNKWGHPDLLFMLLQEQQQFPVRLKRYIQRMLTTNPME